MNHIFGIGSKKWHTQDLLPVFLCLIDVLLLSITCMPMIYFLYFCIFCNFWDSFLLHCDKFCSYGLKGPLCVKKSASGLSNFRNLFVHTFTNTMLLITIVLSCFSVSPSTLFFSFIIVLVILDLLSLLNNFRYACQSPSINFWVLIRKLIYVH